MKRVQFLCIIPIVLALLCLPMPTVAQTSAVETPVPPAPTREFRGLWIATVANIDWPSDPGLPGDVQQKQLIAILDKAAALHFNAVILQVRPACDAIYPSTYEPWSEYLTGTMGQSPSPAYDPLAFAVTEAHKRGLELHAWFNPFRARHPSGKSPVAPNHISQTHPELVRTYGDMQWLDPGEPAAQDYSLNVIMDVVRRYDIDGVHLDDYFYPYKIKDANGNDVDFPDDVSWAKYQRSGGKLKRDDWRRQNVNGFIQHLYQSIKKEKPWVKFGVSPFGIWRPGNPPQIEGYDAYANLYADSRLWLQQGWVDYFAPQLYWKIEKQPQSFPVLLQWWEDQNILHRNLWPGLFTSLVGAAPTDWPADEISYQIRTVRGSAGATGTIHFSAKALMDNRGGIADQLQNGVYAEPALIPASPWLNDKAPGQPTVQKSPDTLSWTAATGGEPVWQWVVQLRHAKTWATQILPIQTTQISAGDADAAAVSAISRTGIQSTPTVLLLP